MIHLQNVIKFSDIYIYYPANGRTRGSCQETVRYVYIEDYMLTALITAPISQKELEKTSLLLNSYSTYPEWKI